jgi:hypothetical protein
VACAYLGRGRTGPALFWLPSPHAPPSARPPPNPQSAIRTGTGRKSTHVVPWAVLEYVWRRLIDNHRAGCSDDRPVCFLFPNIVTTNRSWAPQATYEVDFTPSRGGTRQLAYPPLRIICRLGYYSRKRYRPRCSVDFVESENLRGLAGVAQV